jgi:hypothetical protein
MVMSHAGQRIGLLVVRLAVIAVKGVLRVVLKGRGEATGMQSPRRSARMTEWRDVTRSSLYAFVRSHLIESLFKTIPPTRLLM